MTKFYRDAEGKYLGGFDGEKPPAGAIEIAAPPPHATMLWRDRAWVDVRDYAARRREEYNKRGVTMEALTVAVVEHIGGHSAELLRLAAIRDEVKAAIPKDVP